MSHIPGPWRPGREDLQAYHAGNGAPFTNVYATDKRAGTHPATGEELPLIIAVVEGATIDQEEEKANAALIAAAPELLEACKWAYKALSMPPPVGISHAELLTILTSAIAKADGRG